MISNLKTGGSPFGDCLLNFVAFAKAKLAWSRPDVDLKKKIWWQHHLEKEAEKKAKWGKGGWKDQDEEEEDEKDEAPPGVDADHEPLGKKDGHDCDHDDGSGEAPGLSPAIMVN